jgi:hypothetical protein
MYGGQGGILVPPYTHGSVSFSLSLNQRILNPGFLNQTASYDVASHICQALTLLTTSYNAF